MAIIKPRPDSEGVCDSTSELSLINGRENYRVIVKDVGVFEWIADGVADGAEVFAAPTGYWSRIIGEGGVGAGSSDNTGVFYVSKNFTGVAGALVSGYTTALITSSNEEYNSQLADAKMGDMNKSYPCPWSARNAAMEAMTAGTITKAYIRVLGGSQYSIGVTNSANNGGLEEGNTLTANLTATTPDLTFSDLNDVSSLLKNNIFYHFEENTRITWINRASEIYIGYTATNVAFKSGIYGYCQFVQLFDETSGRGVAQRAFRIANSFAEVDIYGKSCVLNGYFVVLTIHKTVNISFDTVYATKRGSLIGFTNANAEDNGDALPSTFNVFVKDVFQGHDYFPYISLHAVAGYQPLFAIDYSSATRLKTYNYKVINYFCKTNALHVVMNAFITGGNRNCFNHYINLDIDYLQHDIDLVDQAAQTTAGLLIQPVSHGNAASFIRDNHHVSVNIKKAIIDHGLVSLRAIAPTHESSKNNSVNINVGYVLRKYNIGPLGSAVGNNNLFTLPYIQQNSSGLILGEKLTVIFNVEKAIAKVGNCFGNDNTIPTIYAAKTIIKGTYITEDGNPVILLQGSATDSFILDNAVLVAKGAATNSIEVDNGALPVSIYAKDVVVNLNIEAGITNDGNAIVTDADIANYL